MGDYIGIMEKKMETTIMGYIGVIQQVICARFQVLPVVILPMQHQHNVDLADFTDSQTRKSCEAWPMPCLQHAFCILFQQYPNLQLQGVQDWAKNSHFQ